MWALALALPLVVYYAVASGNRHAFVYAAGVSFPLYFMTGMAAYGAMFAAIGPGARLARDRARGWTRQLRITPLRVRTDYLAKTLAAYLVALPALVLVFLAGATLGVRLNVAQWLEMSGLLLVGLVPFVLMGLILGHLIATDALVSVMGWLVVFFALFLGAAERQRDLIGYVRSVPATDELAPVLVELRTALGQGAFEQTMTEGSALALEEAVAYAQRGRGSHNRARSGWESLTASERRVVSLVGQHLTNTEIGERLFISVSTVKSHLNHVFAKLGVTNRGQLAVVAHFQEPSTP
jgi:DNA-binding CsgD family transcriptional regulator